LTGVAGIALLGAFVGFCMWAAWRFAFPPPPPIDVALRRLTRHAAIADTDAGSSFKRQLGERTGSLLEGFGLSLDDTRADARIVGTSLHVHLASKATSAALAAGFAVVIPAVLAIGGVAPPVGGMFGLAMVAAVIGFFGPDLKLRSDAARRRRDFAVAFGSYLDLVSISLAGGMGTEAALVEAARVGDSWSFRLIRRDVDVAQIQGDTIWHALGQLGEELRVPALVELSASIALAGNEGAKVRTSIATKADSLRAAELAEAETEAQEATERMAIPTVMLLLGFVLLVGYPAVAAVLGSF
jgi:tight adherence protein C